MKGADWISERMVFGVMIAGGYLLAIGAAAFLPIAPVSREVVVGAIGSLGTAVGVITNAVFRTDKADKQTAAALANLSASASGNGA